VCVCALGTDEFKALTLRVQNERGKLNLSYSTKAYPVNISAK